MGYLNFAPPGFYHFLSGAIMFGAWAGGIFFFQFWSKTRDRLFLIFGISFWIMALERVVLMFVAEADSEYHFMVYLLRLSAFLLIIYAIFDKNRKDQLN